MDANALQLPQALKDQLVSMGLDCDLELFIKQKALKARAREEKAARTLGKGVSAVPLF